MRRTSTPLRKSPLAERLRHTCLSPDCHPTRRQILACIGAAAASATLPVTPLPAQTASSPRRIDVHHHCYPKPWFDRYSAQLLASDSQPAAIKAWSPQLNLEQMDQNGIATAICSLGNPSASRPATFSKGRTLARACNEVMARMAADHPGPLRRLRRHPVQRHRGEPEGDRIRLRRAQARRRRAVHELRRQVAGRSRLRADLRRVEPAQGRGLLPPERAELLQPHHARHSRVRRGISIRRSALHHELAVQRDVLEEFRHPLHLHPCRRPLPVLAERLDQQMRHPEIAAASPRACSTNSRSCTTRSRIRP